MQRERTIATSFKTNKCPVHYPRWVCLLTVHARIRSGEHAYPPPLQPALLLLANTVTES